MPLLTGKWLYQNDRLQPLVSNRVPQVGLVKNKCGEDANALDETQVCYLQLQNRKEE